MRVEQSGPQGCSLLEARCRELVKTQRCGNKLGNKSWGNFTWFGKKLIEYDVCTEKWHVPGDLLLEPCPDLR